MDLFGVLQTLPTRSALLVHARRWPWTWCGFIVHGAICRALMKPRAPDAPDLDALLLPFDRVEGPRAEPRARAVSRHWLRRWVGGWPALATPGLELASPVDCPIDVIPHQLTPAAMVVRGAGTRLLLADEVGAGKTIEAGLLISELAARHAADRVLVLTPSGLRDQWREELGQRCQIALEIVDRRRFADRQRCAPPGLGPFAAPGRLVISMDLAKQPDVLTSLSAVAWDVLVVDEAHLACGESARMAAVQALGRRARVIALVSATPHSGDAAAFSRLCRVGAFDDSRPLWFRRPAARDSRIASPRIRDLSPARSVDERQAASLMARYARALDAAGTSNARLVSIVLRKRGLSSPAALASSLRHRAAWLAAGVSAPSEPLLPFDAEEHDTSDALQPAVLSEFGLHDRAAELRLLQPTLEAAERAAADWSKARAIRRLLARTRERVLIFTEYRDSLGAIVHALPRAVPVAVLHGGLDRTARTEALARFTNGVARVLVATDVAAEGLNLQHACRLVVHVELPWSPARLEQRNGRVWRLGQRHRVHVWRLLGEPLHEDRIVAALTTRLARIRAAGIEMAGTMSPALDAQVAAVTHASDEVEDAGSISSERLAGDVMLVRALVRACQRPTASVVGVSRPRLPWLRVRGGRHCLARGVVVVCLVPASTRGLRPQLVPMHVTFKTWPPGPPSEWLPAVAAHAAAQVPVDLGLTAALHRRETSLLAYAVEEHRQIERRWQPSLFERRTARLIAATREAAASRVADHRRRLAELDVTTAVVASPVLVLLAE